MLSNLVLRRFVFIEQVEVAFEQGFCALTGETGAGKSLLVDALSLLAGARPTSGMVMPGAKNFEIEASFDVSDMPAAREFLQANDLDDEEGKMIARRIGGGASRSYINGRQVPLALLAEAMSLAVEICGQHEHYSLRQKNMQRDFFDNYAGAQELAAHTRHTYQEWMASAKNLEQAQESLAAMEAMQEQLQQETAELEALDFSLSKWEEYNQTLTRLSNMEDLAAGSAETLDMLTRQIAPLLSQSYRRLSALSRVDDSVKVSLKCIEESSVAADEAARSLQRYADDLQPNPMRREQVEYFVAEAHRLTRQYRIAEPSLLENLLKEKRQKLNQIQNQNNIQRLKEEEHKKRALFNKATVALTEQRRQAAKILDKNMKDLLTRLAMPAMRFKVSLETLPSAGAYGAESVEFLIRAEQNAAWGKFATVASGGELSRLGLALQIVGGIQGARAPKTAVFDEVDSGISGATSTVVGALLQQLGAARQILCVTHLAQVAAHADWHWQVSTTNNDGKKQINIQPLSPSQRVEALAGIVGGVVISDGARANAADLLKQSQRKL